MLLMCRVVEGVYFHSIGNGGRCEGSVQTGMMKTLGVRTCVRILTQLLFQTSHLMANIPSCSTY